MNPILTDLDDIGAADCKGERGAYSTESMCVRFDYKRDAFSPVRLLQRAALGPAPDELKTLIHETTHHLHNVTTPFAIFVHTVRALQASIVYDIAGLIRQAKLPLRFPIVGYLDSLPKPLLANVEGALRIWYTAELFVLRTFGDTEQWRKHYETNPYIIRTDFGAQLEVLEAALTINSHFELNRSGRRDAPPLDFEVPKPSEKDWQFDTAQFASELMTVPTNLRGILESAATVAELWGSDMTLAKFREVVETWRSTALGTIMAPYRFPIRYAIESIKAANLREFVLSYLALCEAALFVAALPEYRSLRHGSNRLIELTPSMRWLELVNVARSVNPISDIEDYARYSNELCARAGWAEPRELMKVTIEDYPRDDDPRRALYRDSMKFREARPSFFVEYPDVCFGPLSRRWAIPVIEYKDRVLFHVDKDFLERVRETYITRILSRRLLLRSDLRVRCPYRASSEEKQELTTLAKTTLESTWLGKLDSFAIV